MGTVSDARDKAVVAVDSLTLFTAGPVVDKIIHASVLAMEARLAELTDCVNAVEVCELIKSLSKRVARLENRYMDLAKGGTP